MTMIDAQPAGPAGSTDGSDVADLVDTNASSRRGLTIALTLVLVLVALIALFVFFGPPSVAAQGGCGGG
jgi:hypothetical protein